MPPTVEAYFSARQSGESERGLGGTACRDQRPAEQCRTNSFLERGGVGSRSSRVLEAWAVCASLKAFVLKNISIFTDPRAQTVPGGGPRWPLLREEGQPIPNARQAPPPSAAPLSPSGR